MDREDGDSKEEENGGIEKKRMAKKKRRVRIGKMEVDKKKRMM